ncbi:23S rRNA (adenine2030-N6)-methyltransferase [Luteimonas sp. J16]|uniref:23S rRNA (adenine(2030)-N(6))-methyltransferase RlmJ n=1 Tax=unclassified Luteimonas TaxID=2629088 RepID=UPI00047DA3C4|nr:MULTISPECIES: 23S rRNA (adenine(2030)-N(6))-methyltransferase RlmJ [unclassified Luteimonas]TWG86945.1 23S rRNA (adenine2030-N6)-methyltransferase [Luteimonas sp. J16]
MNYRHAFHAGNHADVFKHSVLLALCEALASKPAPCFALDTHAGRGLYFLDDEASRRTGEANEGVEALLGHDARPPALEPYRAAIAACRAAHGGSAYPGSPWLLAHTLRPQDAIACCEVQPEEAAALRRCFAGDRRIGVHQRDGYAAVGALLPPRHGGRRIGRGLVLVDPPYEAQRGEFDPVLAALREGLARWPQGMFMLWYPVKQRAALGPFLRRAAQLPAKSVLLAELMVRAEESVLRMNGSGVLVCNPPWRLDATLQALLPALQAALAPGRGAHRLQWLREET